MAATLLVGVPAGYRVSGAQEEAAEAFLAAWARGDVRAAAAAIDAPGEAGAVLERVSRSLGLAGGELTVGDVREENGIVPARTLDVAAVAGQLASVLGICAEDIVTDASMQVRASGIFARSWTSVRRSRPSASLFRP